MKLLTHLILYLTHPLYHCIYIYMPISVPTAVPALLLPSIEEATVRLEEKAIRHQDDWSALTDDRQMQEDFLHTFSKCFNIRVSLLRAGAKNHQLMRWRNTELAFVKEYNIIHDHWTAELITSGMSRAIGHPTLCDPKRPTTSGLREDAMGKIIYEGADTRLTLRFLEAHFPEQYSQQVTINPGATVLPLIADDATGEEAADSYAVVMGQ